MVVRSCLQQLASKYLHVLFKDIETLLNKWRFFPEIIVHSPSHMGRCTAKVRRTECASSRTIEDKTERPH